eukprot:scaffold188032_cov43-Tisochrysis_lutea.AAC.3
MSRCARLAGGLMTAWQAANLARSARARAAVIATVGPEGTKALPMCTLHNTTAHAVGSLTAGGALWISFACVGDMAVAAGGCGRLGDVYCHVIVCIAPARRAWWDARLRGAWTAA